MWIDGVIGSFYFEAKVFDEPSRFGISNGRISKLVIRDKNKRFVASTIEVGSRSLPMMR